MHIEEHFLKIQQWMSPSFPIGSFAYSHGLEWAIETGRIFDANSLNEWLGTLLENGSAKTDAILIALAFHSEEYEDLNRLAIALCPSSERLSETNYKGVHFAKY